jgi:DNA processing protein
MSAMLSANTRAILLLTAPLITGRDQPPSNPLSPGEYRRMAHALCDAQAQPEDLLGENAGALIRQCATLDPDRLTLLLGRGFLLAQAVERWQSRAIWVISRADEQYPRILKERLREDAPPVLYGCGDAGLLGNGLAVVGSRDADDSLIEYAEAIGRLAARANRTIVSGAARGIDQAAMRGGLQSGGGAVGVLADSLERTVVNRENRSFLMEGQLVLISPYDPAARFNVGHAMQRNKIIYALADAAVVVSSDYEKGGTWAGAVEQLGKLRLVPVFVRASGSLGRGLQALARRGALSWPEPVTPEELDDLLREHADRFQQGALQEIQPELPVAPGLDQELDAPQIEDPAGSIQVPESEPPDDSASELLFNTVRSLARRLVLPMTEDQVALEWGVSKAQARAWLQRLVAEGALERRTRPLRFVVASARSVQPQLFVEQDC